MADKYNALTAESCTMPWEGSGFDPAFIGFANRDAYNTKETAVMPQNVRSVGEPWMAHFNPTSTGDSGFYGGPRMQWSVQSCPMMTLSVEPVIAAVRTTSDNERIEETIWNTLWRDLCYINRVYELKFEAIDLQWAEFALEEIQAHLANLLRLCDISQITLNPNNRAVERKGLLHIMGMTGEGDVVSDFRGLVDFINTSIIGVLNETWWCWDFIPGSKRRAALFSNIYKDADDPRNECNLYAFKPACFYFPAVESSNSTWKLVRTTIPATLWDYARLIANALKFLTSQQDFINIATTMQAIMAKDKQPGNGVTITKANFDNYPYFGRPLTLTYSLGMLLAIHNATIIKGLVPSDVYTVIPDGKMKGYPVYDKAPSIVNGAIRAGGDSPNYLVQTFNLPSQGAGTSVAEAFIQVRNRLMRERQPLNMPESWTPDNWEMMIAATQFKTMSFPEQSDTDYELSPKTLGTELISDATIWCWNPETDDFAVGTSFGNCMFVARTSTGVDATSVSRTLSQMAKISDFDFAPITAIVEGDLVSGHNYTHHGYSCDAMHVSFVGFRTLESVKTQFVLNYLGYPLRVPEEGSFMGIKQLADAATAITSNDVKKTNANGGGSKAASGGGRSRRSGRTDSTATTEGE